MEQFEKNELEMSDEDYEKFQKELAKMKNLNEDENNNTKTYTFEEMSEMDGF